LNAYINDHDRKNDDDDDDDKYIIIAVDSTGIKVTNRGQWMDEKWNVQRKGYLKIHVAINIKTKKILALEVTNEKVNDGRRILTKLVNHVLDNHAMKIESVLVDGDYDTNKNFRYFEENEITPGIKLRKDSVLSIRNNRLRNREARLQIKDLLKWKMKRKQS
jgi:Transposase DDE domain